MAKAILPWDRHAHPVDVEDASSTTEALVEALTQFVRGE